MRPLGILTVLDRNNKWILAKLAHISPDTQLQKAGYCEEIDSEYVRCGTASIFFTKHFLNLKRIYTQTWKLA